MPLILTTSAVTVAKFAAGVVDTGGKFVTSVVDTGAVVHLDLLISLRVFEKI